MNLEFNDARECLNRVYEERGYESAQGFISFLSKLDIITMGIRQELNTFLTTLELNKPSRAKRRKNRKQIMNYYKQLGIMDEKNMLLDKKMHEELFGENK